MTSNVLKCYACLLMALFFYTLSAQSVMEGTYILNPTGGDFSTLQEVVTALNNATIGLSGVNIEIPSDLVFNEDCGITLNKSGSASAKIRFSQSGTGNKPLFNFTGSSSDGDFMVKLNGCDYIEIENLSFQAANQNQIENGIILENGCTNNDIYNCSIDLKAYTHSYNSYGIRSLTANASLQNSENHFLSNHISNCFYGYYLIGYSQSYPDQNNIISKDLETPYLTNCRISGVWTENQNHLTISHQDISWTENGASSSIYCIYLLNTNDTGSVISYNTLHNLNAVSAVYGITLNSKTETHHNTIRDITSTMSVYGVYSLSQLNQLLYGNKIYSLRSTSVSTHLSAGISLSSASTVSIYNNLIYGISAGNSTRSIVASAGIMITNPVKAYLSFNTIVLNVTSGNNNISSCLYLSDNNGNDKFELLNNILINNSATGSGTSAAIAHIGTAVSKYTSLTNKNIYYAGSPSSNHLIFRDTGGNNAKQTLSDYKTYFSTKDQNSYTENTQFVSSTDYHISPDYPTNCESNATAVNSPSTITEDIEGNLRSGYQDIGCYEGDFLPLTDIFAPQISLTTLSNTYSFQNRILNVTITDHSGCPVSGIGLPVLYWKINSGSWQSAQGVWNGNNQYQFTFGSSVNKLDHIYYYIVAQDNASTPNLTVYPSEGAGSLNANPLTVSSPPTAPLSYQILNSISGNYYIGSGQTYTSFSADNASGLFKFINETPVSGNTTLLVTSDLTESGEISLNNWISTDENVYSLTIKAQTETPCQIQTSGENLLQFENISHLNIDGKVNDQNHCLVFQNNHSQGTCLKFTGNYTDISLNSIMIEGSESENLSFGLVFSGNTISDITINNNQISNLKTGISVNPNLSATTLAINQNTLHDLNQYGLYIKKANSVSVSANTIKDLSGNYSDLSAIFFDGGSSNIIISGNTMDNIGSTSLSSIVTGLKILSGETVKVYNNALCRIKGKGFNQSLPSIIGLSAQNTSGLKIYFNSIYLSDLLDTPQPNTNSSALFIDNSSEIYTANNLLINKTSSINSENCHHYAFFNDSDQGNYSYLNYNDYYVNTGESIIYSGQDYNLTDWRAASLLDTDSKSFLPSFTSVSDLHLNLVMSHFDYRYGSQYNDSVPEDIDGQTRNTDMPMIGCDEIMHDFTLPVTLTSFTAGCTNDETVQLKWITQSESGLLGFYVYRNNQNLLASAFRLSDLIEPGNTSQETQYSYQDQELTADSLMYYWLKIQNLDGSSEYYGPVSCRIIEEDNNPQIPLKTGFKNIYPNPFNPDVQIQFEVIEKMPVDIVIYNQKGQKVKKLYQAETEKGVHHINWNGKDQQNKKCATGIYFCIMQTPMSKEIKKITLIK